MCSCLVTTCSSVQSGGSCIHSCYCVPVGGYYQFSKVRLTRRGFIAIGASWLEPHNIGDDVVEGVCVHACLGRE